MGDVAQGKRISPEGKVRRIEVRSEKSGVRSGGGGAQIGKRRLMDHDSGSAAPFDTTHTPSFRAVGACYVALSLKIATATMSREIFLVNARDGLTTPENIGSTESAAF